MTKKLGKKQKLELVVLGKIKMENLNAPLLRLINGTKKMAGIILILRL